MRIKGKRMEVKTGLTALLLFMFLVAGPCGLITNDFIRTYNIRKADKQLQSASLNQEKRREWAAYKEKEISRHPCYMKGYESLKSYLPFSCWYWNNKKPS